MVTGRPCQVDWESLFPLEQRQFIAYRFAKIYEQIPVRTTADFDQIYAQLTTLAASAKATAPVAEGRAVEASPGESTPHPPATPRQESARRRPAHFHDGNDDDFEPAALRNRHLCPPRTSQMLVPRRKTADRTKLVGLRRSESRWRGVFLYRNVRRQFKK